MAAGDGQRPVSPALQLYRDLIEHIVMGHETIQDELKKPKEQQDAYLLMGVAEINESLDVAARALESHGLVPDDEALCRLCGGLADDHDDRIDHMVGDEVQPEPAPPSVERKPRKDRPN